MAYPEPLGGDFEHLSSRLRTAEEVAAWRRGPGLAGALVGALAAAFAEILSAVTGTWRALLRRRARRRALAELRALDRRTLADLGIAPSEIESVVAEARGEAAATRLLILPRAAYPGGLASAPARPANDNALSSARRDSA